MLCGGGATSENIKTGGQFSFKLYKYHTNAKKTFSSKICIKYVCKHWKYTCEMSDNTAAAYGTDNMGCHTSDLCNQMKLSFGHGRKNLIFG